MLYLIGLGLNEKSISVEGLEAALKSQKIYLEHYTVDFPYKIEKLENTIGKRVVLLERKDVESDKLLKEAKKDNICLLIYGSPLFATTHISLLEEARKQKVKTKVIYSASIFDGIAEIGLELYKFGKISSLPKWQPNYEPESFLDYIEDNLKINAHSLLLVDISLSFEKALEQFEIAIKKRNLSMGKIVVASNIGSEKPKIYYGTITELKTKKLASPYCFIIPSKMHFIEEESLKKFVVKQS